MTDLRMSINAVLTLQIAAYKLFGCTPTPEDLEHKAIWYNDEIVFHTIKEMYQEITGDVDITGQINPRYVRTGIIEHNTFEQMLNNAMSRYLSERFNKSEKTIQAYTPPPPPRYMIYNLREDEIPYVYSLAHRRVFTITEKMIENDDLGIITKVLDDILHVAVVCVSEECPPPRLILANNPVNGRTFTHGGLQYFVEHKDPSYTSSQPHGYFEDKLFGEKL